VQSSADSALWLFISLMAGAFFASFMATFGRRRRGLVRRLLGLETPPARCADQDRREGARPMRCSPAHAVLLPCGGELASDLAAASRPEDAP